MVVSSTLRTRYRFLMTLIRAHLRPSGSDVNLSSSVSPIWKRLHAMAKQVDMESLGTDADIPPSPEDFRRQATKPSRFSETKYFALLAPNGVEAGKAPVLEEVKGPEFDDLDAETLVGGVSLFWSKTNNPELANVSIYVLPEYRRQGIGRAALDFARKVVLDNSKKKIYAWTNEVAVATGAPDALLPRRGNGAIDPTNASAAFLKAEQFGLDMIEKASTLHLGSGTEREHTRSHIGDIHAAAVAAGDPEGQYELIEWTLPTPEEHLDAYVAMVNQFYMDMPTMSDMDASTMTPERAREGEQRRVDAGKTGFITVAKHRASGDFVGITEVAWTKGSDAGFIDSTWVSKDHRGHQLGLILKTRSALTILDQAPQMLTIRTWNAEENVHMWAINEKLGYSVDFVEGAWMSYFVDGEWQPQPAAQ